MKRILVELIGLFFIVAPVVAAGAPTATLPPAEREGVTEVSEGEVASLVATITRDVRYEALSRLAAERGIRLEPGKARGRDFPEGYRATFIPAIDSTGAEKGFLATSGEVWTLSLSLQNGKVAISEGFMAKSDGKGGATVEVSLMTKPENADSNRLTTKSVSASCQYVKSSGFDISCFAWPDNVFGQYYVNIYRWGTDPDYSHVAWWACYQGAIHVCPVNEALGSPSTWVVCGSPPAHPLG